MAYPKEAVLRYIGDSASVTHVGSAVLIKPDVALATKHQCRDFVPWDDASVYVANASESTTVRVRDCVLHPVLDMALLELAEPLPFPPAKIKAHATWKEVGCILAGYPVFRKNQYTEVPIALKKNVDIDCAVEALLKFKVFAPALVNTRFGLAGASGGGVFTKKGELLALTTCILQPYSEYAAGIPAPDILEFLLSQHVISAAA